MSLCYQCGVGMAAQYVLIDGRRVKLCSNCCDEFIDRELEIRRVGDDY